MASESIGNGRLEGGNPADQQHIDSAGLDRGTAAVDGGDRRASSPRKPKGKRDGEVRGDNRSDQAKGSIIEQLFKQAVEKRITPPDDDEIRCSYPFLWELLTIDRYPDKRDRILPELVIRRVGGGYIVELRDHETCQAKHALVGQLLDFPAALEAALADAEAPWRPFKSYQNKKGIDRHKEKDT